MSNVAPMRVSIFSWYAFDSLLRGKLGTTDRVKLMSNWLLWQVLCAALFGLSLGIYALTSRDVPDYRFIVADVIKMPCLLFFTSLVTCPSLYVFGALRGLRFSAREFAAMLMVAHTILAAVLGSLAPIVLFFALTTNSYSFMVLLTVFSCTLSGLMGIRVFVRSFNEPDPNAPASQPAPVPVVEDKEQSAVSVPMEPIIPRKPQNYKVIWQLLGWWVVLYLFVGAQMGWMLRPFIGHPDMEFQLFRGKGGSLVESVFDHVQELTLGEEKMRSKK